MKQLSCSLSFLLCLSAHAAVYFVAPYGSDSNDGLSTNAPWATLSHATERGWPPTYLQAGDTVYLRGGIYSGNAHSIDLNPAENSNGASNSPITLAAFPGETPIVADTVSPNWGVFLKTKAWWKFDGITWSNCYGGLWLEDVTRVVVTNCTIGYMPAGDNAWSSLWLFGESQFNLFVSNSFPQWGKIVDDYVDEGTPIAIGDETADDPTWYNLFLGNHIYRGGHDCLQLSSARNTFRGNHFHNEGWIPTNSTYHLMFTGQSGYAIETNKWGFYGNRIMKPGDAGDYQIDDQNVFEQNVMHYSGVPADDNGAYGIELGTHRCIYRFNTIAFTIGAGVLFNTSGTASQSSSNAFYGNVIAFCGLSAAQPGNEAFKSWNYGINASGFEAAPRRTNNFIVNNIFAWNGPSNVHPFILTSQAWRTNWNLDFGLPNPLFVSTNGFGDYLGTTGPDFRLQTNSPCIDAGAFLTFATNASGVATNVFQVENSYYFSDGNGLLPGDEIQPRGLTNRVRIVSIDRASSTLTTDAALAVTNGMWLSLAYAGNAPDMGAFESDGSYIPPAPETVATPDISPDGAVFTNSVDVTIICSTTGASIRYTLDGATPSVSSSLYSAPLTFTNSVTLKARGFKEGATDSSQATASFDRYTPGEPTPPGAGSGNIHNLRAVRITRR